MPDFIMDKVNGKEIMREYSQVPDKEIQIRVMLALETIARMMEKEMARG